MNCSNNRFFYPRCCAKRDWRSGDKVAFLMDNGLVTAQLFLGTMYGGYVAVPLNVRAGVAQLSYMLNHCDAKMIFVEDEYTPAASGSLGTVRRDIRVISANVDGPLPVFETAARWSVRHPTPMADDVALLMYSSGQYRQAEGSDPYSRSILAHGRNSIEAHQLSAADRSLLVLPFYHINAECVTLIPTLLSGGSVVVAHRFVVSQFWDWIDDLPSHLVGSGPDASFRSSWIGTIRQKDRRQAAFQRIRFFRSSSAPLSPRCIGSFWTSSICRSCRPWARLKGAMSSPIRCLRARTRSDRRACPGASRARIIDRDGSRSAIRGIR